METPEPGPTGAPVTTATRRTTSRRRAGRRGRSSVVAIYGGLLLAAIVAFASHEWGATVHSSLAIAVIGVVSWHVLSQRRWVTSAVRRRLAHPERFLVVLNTVLAVDFILVNLSGFPVWFWDVGGLLAQVHSVTGITFLVLVPLHLVLNRHRLLARLRGGRHPTRASAA